MPVEKGGGLARSAKNPRNQTLKHCAGWHQTRIPPTASGSKSLTFDPCRAAVERQAWFLARRFGLSAAVAAATASLVFGERA